MTRREQKGLLLKYLPTPVYLYGLLPVRQCPLTSCYFAVSYSIVLSYSVIFPPTIFHRTLECMNPISQYQHYIGLHRRVFYLLISPITYTSHWSEILTSSYLSCFLSSSLCLQSLCILISSSPSLPLITSPLLIHFIFVLPGWQLRDGKYSCSGCQRCSCHSRGFEPNR